MKYLLIILFLLQFSSKTVNAQPAFHVIPLGVFGGTKGDNLSAYLIAASGSDHFVCLDAGTVYNGIEKAVSKGSLQGSPEEILRKNIKGYFISHAHLDHVSGLIVNSIEDTTKQVYALPKCIDIIKNHYFNWESWPNMGSDGVAPALKKYRYKPLQVGEEVMVENTGMFATAFPLSHSNPYESAAYLLRNGENYALYFGDTGPDEIEKTDKIQHVWNAVAPLVKAGKLKGIFLEISYPNEQPDHKLYGHLTPKWFMKTMDDLARLAGNDQMHGLNVVVTHIKPTGENIRLIKKQLFELNTLKLQLIFPEQGVAFQF